MKFKKAQRGFTLVEVTMAGGIFSIVAAGLYATFAALNRSTDTAEQRLYAAYLGRQLLEDIRAKADVATFLNCDGASRPWPEDLSANPIVATYGGQVNYICTVIGAGLPGEGARRVTLTIRWTPL